MPFTLTQILAFHAGDTSIIGPIANLQDRPVQRKVRDYSKGGQSKRCACGNTAGLGDGLCSICRGGKFRKKRPVSGWPVCSCGHTASPNDGCCKRCRPLKPRPVEPPKKQKRRKSKSRRISISVRATVVIRQKQKPHSRRLGVIEQMGFRSYKAYTNSALWRGIRGKVLESDGQCCKCRGPANQVHHSRYTAENLSGRSLEFLHSVCCSCHQTAHFKFNGDKRTLAETNRELGIR